MYNTQYPNEYLDYVTRPGREWIVEIPNLTVGHISSVYLENTLGEKSIFNIGGCLSSYMKLEIELKENVDFTFKNTAINPIVKLRTFVKIDEVLTEVWQPVPLGEYIISSYEKKNECSIKLEAHDKMTHDKYGHKKYYCNYSFPIDSKTIVLDICSKLNADYIESTIPTYTLNHSSKINGKPMNEVLKYIATLYGGFCRFNKEGKLEFFKLNNTGITHALEHGVKEINETENTLVIKGIKCQIAKGENFIYSGDTTDENSLIQISNFDMTQTRLDQIYNEYKDYSFSGLSDTVKFNPALDCGDIIKVRNANNKEKQILLQSLNFSINGGPSGDYICDYDLEEVDYETLSDRNVTEEEIADIEDRLDVLENTEVVFPELEEIESRLEALENLPEEDFKEYLDPINAELDTLEQRIEYLEECCEEMHKPTIVTVNGLEDKAILKDVKYIMYIDLFQPVSFIYDENILDVELSNWSEGKIAVTGIAKGISDLTVYYEDTAANIRYEGKCTIEVYEQEFIDLTNPILVDCDSTKQLTYNDKVLLSNKINENKWDPITEEYFNELGIRYFSELEGFSMKGLLYEIPISVFKPDYGYTNETEYAWCINCSIQRENFVNEKTNVGTIDMKIGCLLTSDTENCLYFPYTNKQAIDNNINDEDLRFSIYMGGQSLPSMSPTDTNVHKITYVLQSSLEHLMDINAKVYVFVGTIINLNDEPEFHDSSSGMMDYKYPQASNYQILDIEIGNYNPTDFTSISPSINTVTDSNLLNINCQIYGFNAYVSIYPQE